MEPVPSVPRVLDFFGVESYFVERRPYPYVCVHPDLLYRREDVTGRHRVPPSPPSFGSSPSVRGPETLDCLIRGSDECMSLSTRNWVLNGSGPFFEVL